LELHGIDTDTIEALPIKEEHHLVDTVHAVEASAVLRTQLVAENEREREREMSVLTSNPSVFMPDEQQ